MSACGRVAKLKNEVEEKDKELKAKGPAYAGSSRNVLTADTLPQEDGRFKPIKVVDETKYKNIISRMKTLLERRQNLQRARHAYEREIHKRTELESFLRQCIKDVQFEIVGAGTSSCRRRPYPTGDDRAVGRAAPDPQGPILQSLLRRRLTATKCPCLNFQLPIGSVSWNCCCRRSASFHFCTQRRSHLVQDPPTAGTAGLLGQTARACHRRHLDCNNVSSKKKKLTTQCGAFS